MFLFQERKMIKEAVLGSLRALQVQVHGAAWVSLNADRIIAFIIFVEIYKAGGSLNFAYLAYVCL